MTIFRGRGFARSFLMTASAALLAFGGLPGVHGIAAVPGASAQGPALPKPFVSRAIDATLMELTPATRATFGIGPRVQGVLVLSTDPSGIAAQNGILPGDIITDVRGRRVLAPIDVDTHVLYYLKHGDTAFQFAGSRGGSPFSAAAQITLALFDAVIDLALIGSWSAYSYGSFSYASYYEEYRVTIVEEYSYSETVIEQTVESASFESEMTSEETVTEESTEAGTQQGEDDSADQADDPDPDSAEADADDDDDGDEGGEDDSGEDPGDDEDVDLAAASGPVSPWLAAFA